MADLPDPLDRPLGYWLKALDAALTRGIDRLHDAAGITRTDWQVLETIAAGPALNETALHGRLAPVVEADLLAASLRKLVRRGWLEQPERPVLTPLGRERHAALRARQMAFRRSLMQGVAEDDYRRMVETLRAMLANVLSAEAGCP